MQSKIILHPASFLPIHHLAILAKYPDQIVWERQDNFQKQTYRNRYHIGNDSGVQVLSIPVKHSKGNRQKYSDIQTESVFNWHRLHWKSIQTAYRSAPFFEFFETELQKFFESSHQNLFNYNLDSTRWICNRFELEFPETYTSQYHKEYAEESVHDLRHIIKPKEADFSKEYAAYNQVFEERIGFLPELSCLDLLFNIGPKAGKKYLENFPISFLF